jgi:hypothetical protein
MTLPIGTWNVVTNLHDAILSITNVDAAGNITGTLQVDASHTYTSRAHGLPRPMS